MNILILSGCRVLVRGVKDKGDIKNTNALNEAFELGQQL
jgi:hypothetical protein